MPQKIEHNALKLSKISHGFFTRKGGGSEGIYASLNCGIGSDDDKETVLKNRAAVAEDLGVVPENLVTVRQVHSAKVAVVDQPWPRESAPEADALVTAKSGIALGILTADCAPILFACGKTGIVGAAHAGWKGAIGGIIEQTVEEMKRLGAKSADIVAVVGPAISGTSYEVGADFIKPFLEQDAANKRFFAQTDKSSHLLFDLGGYVRDRLFKAGVGRIECLDRDTYAEETAFFSYRRSCHRKEKDYGRQISAIARKP